MELETEPDGSNHCRALIEAACTPLSAAAGEAPPLPQTSSRTSTRIHVHTICSADSRRVRVACCLSSDLRVAVNA